MTLDSLYWRAERRYLERPEPGERPGKDMAAMLSWFAWVNGLRIRRGNTEFIQPLHFDGERVL